MASKVDSNIKVIEFRIIGRHPTAEDLEEELEDLGKLSAKLLKSGRGLAWETTRDLGDELARLCNTIEDRLIGATSPTLEAIHG